MNAKLVTTQSSGLRGTTIAIVDGEMYQGFNASLSRRLTDTTGEQLSGIFTIDKNYDFKAERRTFSRGDSVVMVELDLIFVPQPCLDLELLAKRIRRSVEKVNQAFLDAFPPVSMECMIFENPDGCNSDTAMMA